MADMMDIVLMVGRQEIKTLDEAKEEVIKNFTKKHGKAKVDKAIKYGEGKYKAMGSKDITDFLSNTDLVLTDEIDF